MGALGRRRPPVSVESGERVLAWTDSDRGPLAGTARALYLPEGRLPWEEVEAASWDEDSLTWRVTPVARWGEVRPVYSFVLGDARNFLQLARERVTASLVLQRFEAVRGRSGFKVVVRRAPGSTGDPALFVEYDPGIDPDDPGVQTRVDAVLAQVRGDLGLG